MGKEVIIQELFSFSPAIRYVAIYLEDQLIFKQREEVTDNSAGETDRFEELLVNPTLLTLASQREYRLWRFEVANYWVWQFQPISTGNSKWPHFILPRKDRGFE